MVIKILVIILGLVIVVNLAVIDVILFKDNRTNTSLVTDVCPEECNQIIDEKIGKINIPTPQTVTADKEVKPTEKQIEKKIAEKSKKVSYIPIPGSGSTLENKWVDLPGTEFYISSQDYPNLVGAYFEANMKLINGNGSGFVRLFDTTVGIEVWGGEVSTNSQSFTSVSSGNLTIRQGTHLYKVQAKSLTADTTVFNFGRIKMITEE